MNEPNPVRRVSEARACHEIQDHQIATFPVLLAEGGLESVVVGEGETDLEAVGRDGSIEAGEDVGILGEAELVRETPLAALPSMAPKAARPTRPPCR